MSGERERDRKRQTGIKKGSESGRKRMNECKIHIQRNV
jgi:hypothetical protein